MICMGLLLAAGAWAQGAPEFQNIVVAPTPFSPNGDGAKDQLDIDYELTENATWVTVEVRTLGGDLVRILLDGISQSAGAHSLVWDGRNESSSLAPDGDYKIHFAAGNAYGQATERERAVALDATAPRALIVEVSPMPFTPDLPLADDTLTVVVQVSDSEPADSVTVAIRPRGDANGDTLSLNPTFTGDGTYAAYWSDQDDEEGEYEIEVSISDSAGNRGLDRSSFVLDKSPPLVGITDPQGDTSYSELPDSVFGRAFDVSDVRKVEISYDERGFGPVAVTTGQDTISWSAPLRDSLQGEGDHTIEVRATDDPGHLGVGGELGGPSTIVVTLDTEAPPPPVLDPLPASVRKSSLAVRGVASQADTAFLYIDDFEAPALTLSVPTGGRFSGTLELHPGENAIAASSTDLAGNRSSLSNPSVVVFNLEFGIFFNERFRPGDSFEISLSEPAREVRLALYSTSGRLVRVLRADGPSANFEVAWDGADASGSAVNNGVYLCRFEASLQNGSVLSDKALVALVR